MPVKSPNQGEIVICKITKINPHSAFAHIVEYNSEGLIHISEVASGWVKDIGKHLKEGQTVVAKVLSVDGRHISLSVKRVDKNQRKSKLREYKNEIKARKLLEITAEDIGQKNRIKDVEKSIRDKFGSLYPAFEPTQKTYEVLKETLDEKWAGAIREIAEKSVKDRTFDFKAELNLVSYEPDGVKRIVKVLKEAEKTGMGVSYISAPNYLLKFSSKDAKKGENEFGKKLKEIESFAKKNACFEGIKVINT